MEKCRDYEHLSPRILPSVPKEEEEKVKNTKKQAKEEPSNPGGG